MKKLTYRSAAQGQSCKLRLPGCRNEIDTVVLAHRPGWVNKSLGGDVIGWSLKGKDLDGVDACDHCHCQLDMRTKWASTWDTAREDIIAAYDRGVEATRENRRKRGIIP